MSDPAAKILCPSILNLPIDNMRAELEEIAASGVDIIHVDLMDGAYVPNFGMSIREIDLIREITTLPIDCHMMVQRPGRYVQLLADHGVDIIYIHPEAEIVPTETLAMIGSLGKKAGIAVNPGVSIEHISAILPLCDYVMVMGVNPGHAGRSYMNYVTPKFEQLAKLRDQKNYPFKIVLDGGADERVITNLYHACGVEGYVLGKQLFFDQPNRTYAQSVNYIRGL